MNIVIDAHFPRKLVLIFREVGFIAFHTLGMPEQNRTTDQQILAFAEEHDCIVMTKDADFVDSYHLYNKPKKLLLVSTGNIRNKELVELLTVNLTQIMTLFEKHKFIELNRERLIVHE